MLRLVELNLGLFIVLPAPISPGQLATLLDRLGQWFHYVFGSFLWLRLCFDRS